MATTTDDDPFEELRGDLRYPLLGLFRRYGGGYRLEFALGGVANVLARALELTPALILGVAIDALFTGQGGYDLPLVPDAMIPETAVGQFWFSAAAIATAYALGAGLNWTNSWAWNHFAQHFQHEVRVDTYDVVQRLEMRFFDDRQTGEVMSILNNDVNRLEQFLTNDLNTLVRIVVLVLGVGAVMLWLNWQLALVALASIPILAVASYLFVRIIHPKYRAVRASVGALNARLENNIGGIEVIKAYGREGFERERVTDASGEYLGTNWDAIVTRIKFFPTLRVVTGFGFVLTFIVGGWWVLFGAPAPFSGTLTVGTFVAFLLYARRFLWPMHQFGNVINNFQYARAAAERIVGLMDSENAVADSPTAIDLDDVAGRVEYDGVAFAYDEETVLEDVNFVAEPGQYVGLVGPTGAGKTTLLKLLMRFYDAGEGSVRIDGHDVREVTMDSLRDAIGYVSQDPYLFHGTVRENIAYGLPDVDDEDILDAARRAGAYEFIAALPDGLDTLVGERGVKLSGGQRQRVSLARAILKDPEILILDEATSHVDNETEVLIQSSLNDLIADRTTFAIAHRLSTVRDADQILVLDGGRIVERGTHEELLAEGGLYANLWSVQVGEIDDLPPEFVARAARRQAQIMPED